MPKVSTKRRSQPTPAPADDDIFGHFAAHGRPLGPDPGPAKAPDPQVAALLAKISGMEEQITSLQDGSRRQMMAAPAPQQQQQRTDPSKLKLDLSGIPDPLENREKFEAELALRINALVDAREYGVRQELTQRTDQATASEQLWTGFTAKYEDWAEYPELVESVAVKLTQKAIKEGIDPHKYMFQNTQVFYADVAKELGDRYGSLVAEKDPDPAGPSRVSRAEQSEDTGRTGGIFSGQESGGKPTATRETQQPDMIADLHAIQRKTGFW